MYRGRWTVVGGCGVGCGWWMECGGWWEWREVDGWEVAIAFFLHQDILTPFSPSRPHGRFEMLPRAARIGVPPR